MSSGYSAKAFTRTMSDARVLPTRQRDSGISSSTRRDVSRHESL